MQALENKTVIKKHKEVNVAAGKKLRFDARLKNETKIMLRLT